MRRLASIALLSVLLAAACDPGGPGLLEGEDVGTPDSGIAQTDTGRADAGVPPSIEEELAGAVVPPGQYLAVGSLDGYEPREIPSYDETRDLLATDPQYEELARALTAAGLDADQSAALVYSAAGHNSAQPHDPVYARAKDFNEDFSGAVETFNTELDQYEAMGGVVDRITLQQLLPVTIVLNSEVPQ